MLSCCAAGQANDVPGDIEKELDLMMTACSRAQLHCADSYLKTIRQRTIAPRGQESKEHVLGIYLGAWMLHMLGEISDAETEYKRASALSKKTCGTSGEDGCDGVNLTINNKFAQFYIDEKRYAEALAVLRDAGLTGKADEKSPAHADAMVVIATQLGDIFVGLKRYGEADVAYANARNGIEARSASWNRTHREYWPGQIDDVHIDDVAVRIATAYQRSGKRDLAMALLAPILAEPEKSRVTADAMELAADIHVGMGEESQAQEMLRRSISLREEELAERCTVRWSQVEKLALTMQHLAAICREGTCRSESASLSARATGIYAASRQRPFVWKAGRCRQAG